MLRYSDLRTSILQKMFLTEEDISDDERSTFTSNIINLMKEGLSCVANNFKPNIKDYTINHFDYKILSPDIHLVGILVEKLLETGDETVTESVVDTNCNLVTFGLGRFGKADVYSQKVYMLGDTVVDVNPSGESIKDTFTNNGFDDLYCSYASEDTLETINSVEYTVRNDITKVVFTKSSYNDYFVNNLFFYDTRLKTTSTEIVYEMPNDFLSYNSIASNNYISSTGIISSQGPLKYLGRKRFVLPISKLGTYIISYNAEYPAITNYEEENSSDLGISDSVLLCLTAYVASQLLGEDNPVRSISLKNEFEIAASRLDNNVLGNVEVYTNSWEE